MPPRRRIPGSRNHPALLIQVWTLVAQAQNMATRIATTICILNKGPNGPDDEPDRGLRVWIDAQDEKRREVLADIITQPDLKDAHGKRLWQQAIRITANLGPDFFLDVFPKVLAFPSINETASAIFVDTDHVSEILGSTARKAQLSQSLAAIFTQASTKTIKSEIASWCNRLNGQASLSRLKPEVLTDDDMTILWSQFPGSSTLKKIEKARQKEI